MKKGIWACTESNLEDCFKLTKAAGFDGIEVSYAETDSTTTYETDDEAILKIKKLADKAKIGLYSVASGFGFNVPATSNDKKDRDKWVALTKRQLEIAKLLECESILSVIGVVKDGNNQISYEDAYENAIKSINEIVPYAKELNIKIAIENVGNHFLLSPLETRKFIDEIDSDYVGIYLDVGNVIYNGGYPDQWIRILGSRIFKVHFKDFKMNSRCFVDLLSGDVNYPVVMKALKNINYDGWVTAEVEAYKYYPSQMLINTSMSMDVILNK